MRISGKKIEARLNEDVLILPRGESGLMIRAKAIPDFDDFNKICPVPKPPGKLTKDGWVPNTEDETYKQRIEQHAVQRIGWMMIESLQEVEWDTVNPDDPKTWPKWEDDLKEAGFTTVEANHILALVLEVNSLNEVKLKEARDSFLRGQEQVQSESSSQTTERNDSQSGEPANE